MGSWIRVSDEERAGRRYIRSPIGLALSDTGHLACFIFYSFCKKQIIFYIIILVSQSCPTLCNPMDCSPPGSSVLGESPGKKTGVDYHARLQGIFPTQVSNPRLPYYRQILYCLSHQGSPIKIICRGKKKKNRTLGTAICL